MAEMDYICHDQCWQNWQDPIVWLIGLPRGWVYQNIQLAEL